VCALAHTAFEMSGDVGLLLTGIEYGRAAHADLNGRGASAASVATNLANLLRDYAGRTGDTSAIEEAARVVLAAAAVTPAEHPDTVLLVIALATVHFARYEQTGELAQADRGVDLLRDAVRRCVPGHPVWKAALADLSGILHALYLRTSDGRHLDASIDSGREVLQARLSSRAEANARANLGASLQVRYLLRRDPADLVDAVSEGRAALALDADEVNRPAHRHNLGTSMRYLAGLTGDARLRQAACELSRAAVEATGTDEPARAVYLNGLAEALLDTAAGADAVEADAVEADAVEADAVEADAVRALDEAAATLAAAPAVRIRAARRLADVHARSGRWTETVSALATALAQLPYLVPRHLARNDQEYHLSRQSGLGSDAAAAALASGSPVRAMELLEAGRAVLFSQGLLDREPELVAADPVLTRRLREVRAGIHAENRRLSITSTGPTR
jgi:hypothetical protein